MEQLNRAQRRQPDLWAKRTHGHLVDGFELVAPVPGVPATGAVVVTVTRQQRRLQARMQAKEAARRSAKGVTA